MKSSTLCLAPAVLVLSGCASSGASGGAVPNDEFEGLPRVDFTQEAAPQEASYAVDAWDRPRPPRSEASRLSVEELAIWNDPAFQRRFVESYIAETEVEPTVTLLERERLQKILDLIADDRVDKAVKQLKDELEDGGASAVFDFTLANIYFQRERLEEAIRSLEAATSKYSKFRRAWQNLGVSYFRSGELEKAAPAFTKVIELGGGNAVTYGMLGFCYASAENPVAAETAYRMAVLLDPETMDWKRGLAISLFKQSRYADAAALCGTLIEEQPSSAELWLLQANAFVGLSQPLRAAENYEFVERMGKSTVDSLTNLGDIYVNEEVFDLAVRSYVRALEEDADKSVDRAIRASKVLTSRGAVAETKTLLAAIETHYGDSLATDTRKDLLKLRSRIAVREGSGEEEARVLEEIVRIDPMDGEALILLGLHAGRHEDVEQAIFYFERAAALDAFEEEAKLRHAQLLVGEGRYDKALPLLERVMELNPRKAVEDYLANVRRAAQTAK